MWIIRAYRSHDQAGVQCRIIPYYPMQNGEWDLDITKACKFETDEKALVVATSPILRHPRFWVIDMERVDRE